MAELPRPIWKRTSSIKSCYFEHQIMLNSGQLVEEFLLQDNYCPTYILYCYLAVWREVGSLGFPGASRYAVQLYLCKTRHFLPKIILRGTVKSAFLNPLRFKSYHKKPEGGGSFAPPFSHSRVNPHQWFCPWTFLGAAIDLTTRDCSASASCFLIGCWRQCTGRTYGSRYSLPVRTARTAKKHCMQSFFAYGPYVRVRMGCSYG